MKSSLCCAGLVFFAANLHAADWPQYRGPDHDGSTPEKISMKWPQEGPKQAWKATLGDSFGSFAVGGGKAFCFIQRKVDGQDKQVAIALNVNSGKELWSTPLGEPVHDNQGGDGPRSTPTVDGDRVYLLGAHLILSCLDTANGKIIWQHDIAKEFEGVIISWFHAGSPVMDGDLIFVNGGGSGKAFLAFDKKTGDVVWKSGNDKPTHASPVPATIWEVRQVIFFTQAGLVSVEAKTGKQLWRYPFPYNTSTASDPIVWKDVVYCSAGYGVGAGACRIAKGLNGSFDVKELWRMKGQNQNHWTTPVCKDGYLYGIYGFKEFGKAPLKCVEIETGKEMWSEPGFGSGGGTILVGGTHILVQGDKGPLVLVEAKTDGYKEVARCQPLGGKCWTMPVVSNGKIFARNTKEGVCLDVSLEH